VSATATEAAHALEPQGSYLIAFEVSGFAELLAHLEFDHTLLRRVEMIAGGRDGGGESQENSEMEPAR
jgi:hypothetical protein